MGESNSLRWLFGIIITMLIISACAPSNIKEKSVPELIDEIHDLDTETTASYNNFDSDFTKFSDSAFTATTLEALKTVQLYADRSKQSGKKVLDSFNVLLSKVSDIKKKSLNTAQKAYVDKLELATDNYKEVVKIDLEIVDKLVKLSAYSVHNTLFVTHHRAIIISLLKLPGLDEEKNWAALKEEIQRMDNSLKSAKEEVRLMKEQISFNFLDDYENFVVLMQEHSDKLKLIVDKKQAGKYVSQEEINEADNPGLKALAIFKTDKEGTIYAEGEEDEVEAYNRENVYPLTDKSETAFNSAQAYYDDAKLRYEQLVKSTTTNS